MSWLSLMSQATNGLHLVRNLLLVCLYANSLRFHALAPLSLGTGVWILQIHPKITDFTLQKASSVRFPTLGACSRATRCGDVCMKLRACALWTDATVSGPTFMFSHIIKFCLFASIYSCFDIVFYLFQMYFTPPCCKTKIRVLEPQSHRI